MLNQVVPTFLYPTSRQFLFDALCERIVRELEKRNWQVPGLAVEFDTYGSGEQKMMIVREISGADFRLHFGRPQGLLPGGRWNDVAAISDLTIPGFQLSVYSDNSGPTFYVYVGEDWEADKHWFFHSSKVNSKLYGDPRRYLKYSGRYSRSLPAMLVHDNDLGREYDPIRFNPDIHDPKPYEFQEYLTEAIFVQFMQWLNTNVLAVILAQPEQEPVDPEISEPTPFPAELFPKIYARVTGEDIRRINLGQTNIDDLDDADRFALCGGRRLLPLTISQDGSLRPEVFDGYLWCVTDQMSPGTVFEDVLDEIAASYETHLVQIVPATADGVYVIDWAVQDEYRQMLREKYPDITTMSDAQYAEYKRTLARTLIPVSRYFGGYRNPMIMISRELDFHEVVV